MGIVCVSSCRCCVCVCCTHSCNFECGILCSLCLMLVVTIWWKRTRVWVLLWQCMLR